MLLTPRQHRESIRHACQIGTQPTARQIRMAYARYLARWTMGSVTR